MPLHPVILHTQLHPLQVWCELRCSHSDTAQGFKLRHGTYCPSLGWELCMTGIYSVISCLVLAFHPTAGLKKAGLSRIAIPVNGFAQNVAIRALRLLRAKAIRPGARNLSPLNAVVTYQRVTPAPSLSRCCSQQAQLGRVARPALGSN